VADTPGANSEIGRILVKLRASAPLGAAAARANLRPVFGRPFAGGGFGVDGAAQWFVADVPDLAVSPDTQANPWDFAHARVADQLGVAEDDVVFAEPDWVHGEAFRVDSEGQGTCAAIPQDPNHGKAVGSGDFAWHLGTEFSQLAAARDAVRFADPRVRIGHLDTGYDPHHETRPKHLLRELGRSFVDEDRFQNSAVDPDNEAFLLDNSGHGTGTLGILAGGSATAQPEMLLGGAPEAEVLPVRISDRVVLLRTSALAAGLQYAADSGCDVITLSMGGLPSRLWGEVVDKLYERGVCICAAAGNHFGSTPPRVLVYPARFPRVIAVCGVMADQTPYADLDGLVLEGSYGPDSVMGQAIAAYTPNIPWPQFGCRAGVRLDGEGTSAATPQVAAAAALWFENHKQRLPRDWRRVEAVRHALFSTARKGDATHFGNGILQAHSALSATPDLNRPRSRTSDLSFALFRLITGLGLAETPVREQMFNLELEQRVLLNPRLQEIVPDPDRDGVLKALDLRELMTAIIEDSEASDALRKHVAMRYPAVTGRSAPTSPKTKGIVAEVVRACDAVPQLRDPAYRRLRVYAVDPSFSTRLETAGIDETTLQVRWESLEPANKSRTARPPTPAGGEEPEKREPGPMGEYFEIDDVDPADAFYGMVNLDDSRLLAQDGLPPSEGNPHFHQQMVYAVAMSTVQQFERALGRPVFWRPMPDRTFRRRLTLRPHALRQANAFYSPENVALLFGYFDADADDPGTDLPGGRIYSCLSHDIIAHETTHAILDGMQRCFNQPTNPDVLAFHEAFADLVALLQHFALTDVLEHEIMRTRGNLEAESVIGRLAIQFGRASGNRAALRDAIGRMEDGKWHRLQPDPAQYHTTMTPHARGALLVAAIFDAFLAIYNTRTADLVRLSSGGSGVLPAGAIHPDLVHRLCDEASKSAKHVLTMIIRALDYLPPVDVTFFEFLRAVITADSDLIPDDRLNYRVALIDAFRRRGIYPKDGSNETSAVGRTLSVETLRWRSPDSTRRPKHWDAIEASYMKIAKSLKPYADQHLYLKQRGKRFSRKLVRQQKLKEQFHDAFKEVPDFAREVGLNPDHDFEVEELRSAMRIGPDGQNIPQVLISLTQTIQVRSNGQSYRFPGGSTLIIDLTVPAVRYCVSKSVDNTATRKRTAEFLAQAQRDPLHALFFRPDPSRPFAALHQLSQAP
jgi:Subtilase family